jgi:glycosyltransferase involved in cell wall biosynthesis
MSTVSVIIPAFNQGHFLADAVESVLNQTYPDVEVIVVDDGSTDETAVVAQSFTDPRVSYIYQENRGLSGARNSGIRHAAGEYLSYLDSDDLFLPEKLELLVGELERRPDLGFVAGQAIPVDEHGNQVGKLFDKGLPDRPEELLLGNPFHVGSVLVRREWQERAGFFDESLRSYEDWDMWLRLLYAGCQMGYAAQPVSLYRFHTAQMTRDGRQMTTATFAVLNKLFNEYDLPPAWLALKEKAYSRAYLRAAAQSYRVMAFADGQANLAQAVTLDPALLADDAEPLARRLMAWTNLPKFPDRLAYLEDIYNHLPPELAALQARRGAELGRAAMQLAYEAYQAGDMGRTRTAVRRAFRYQPARLTNRGALSIFVRSHLSS